MAEEQRPPDTASKISDAANKAGNIAANQGFKAVSGKMVARAAAAGIAPGVGNLALEAGLFVKNSIRKLAKGLGSIGSGFRESDTNVMQLIGAAVGSIFSLIGLALIVSTITIAFIMFMINSGAYVAPYGNLGAGVSGGPSNSIYIDITKSPTPPGPFENSVLPLTVNYTITISATTETLTNISFNYSCNVLSDGGATACPPISPEIPAAPESIAPGESFTITYTSTYDSTFVDSLVTDSLQVTADAGANLNEVSTGTASIVIGNPPLDCPSGWPIMPFAGEAPLLISQGPRGNFSHSANGLEAIDILATGGHPITATHNGTVHGTYDGTFDNYGKLVILQGNCNGVNFYSLFAHLTTISVGTGDTITHGQLLGTSGNTGTYDPHLHYEFRVGSNIAGTAGPYPNNPPYMAPPYLPKLVPTGCTGYTNCSLSIP